MSRLTKIIIFIIIFLFLLIFGRYALALVIDTVNIYTEYINQNDIQSIDELLTIEVEINESPNGKFQYQFPLTFRSNYSSPYTMQIIFQFDERQIQLIDFESLMLSADGKEFDLFELDDISVSLTRHYIDSNISKFRDLNEDATNKFKMEKRLLFIENTNIFIKDYYLNFHELPIDYKKDKDLNGAYRISVLLLNGEKVIIENDFNFKQEIDKRVMKSVLKRLFDKP